MIDDSGSAPTRQIWLAAVDGFPECWWLPARSGRQLSGHLKAHMESSGSDKNRPRSLTYSTRPLELPLRHLRKTDRALTTKTALPQPIAAPCPASWDAPQCSTRENIYARDGSLAARAVSEKCLGGRQTQRQFAGEWPEEQNPKGPGNEGVGSHRRRQRSHFKPVQARSASRSLPDKPPHSHEAPSRRTCPSVPPSRPWITPFIVGRGRESCVGTPKASFECMTRIHSFRIHAGPERSPRPGITECGTRRWTVGLRSRHPSQVVVRQSSSK